MPICGSSRVRGIHNDLLWRSVLRSDEQSFIKWLINVRVQDLHMLGCLIPAIKASGDCIMLRASFVLLGLFLPLIPLAQPKHTNSTAWLHPILILYSIFGYVWRGFWHTNYNLHRLAAFLWKLVSFSKRSALCRLAWHVKLVILVPYIRAKAPRGTLC